MAEQIVEMCPNCGNEVAVWWDMQKDGYQIFCPHCGKPMMLCSMCDRSPCDWAEEKGCKHSAGKDNNVPTNDGWIPVDERLPEDDSTKRYIVTDTDGHVWSSIWYGYAEEENKTPCFYCWDDDMWQCYKPDVIAWRPLPEPYQPEQTAKRPEWQERMLHTFLGGHT